MEKVMEYSKFLALRRELEIRDGVSPIVLTEPTSSGGYYLSMDVGSSSVVALVSVGGDLTDFTTNRQKYCDVINWPVPDQINSHNFCSSASWINTPASVYGFLPSPGNQARLTQIIGILDAGIDLSPTKKLNLTSWFTKNLAVPCPAFVPGVPTSFGTPLFNPGGGVFTGWYQVPVDAYQDYATWLHFTNGVMDYGLRHYSWDTVTKLKLRARDFRNSTDDVNEPVTELNVFYQFFNNNDYYALRSSLNERLEAWIEGDQQLAQAHGKGARFAVYYSLYPEW